MFARARARIAGILYFFITCCYSEFSDKMAYTVHRRRQNCPRHTTPVTLPPSRPARLLPKSARSEARQCSAQARRVRQLRLRRQRRQKVYSSVRIDDDDADGRTSRLPSFPPAALVYPPLRRHIACRMPPCHASPYTRFYRVAMVLR